MERAVMQIQLFDIKFSVLYQSYMFSSLKLSYAILEVSLLLPQESAIEVLFRMFLMLPRRSSFSSDDAPHVRADAECQDQDHKDRGGGVCQCLVLTVYLKVPDLDRQCLCRAERVERAGRGCQVPVAPAQVASGPVV